LLLFYLLAFGLEFFLIVSRYAFFWCCFAEPEKDEEGSGIAEVGALRSTVK
jgi:hypothetical protein